MTTAPTRAGARATAAGPPLVELRGVSKRFVRSLDVAMRIGNLLGAGAREEVVRAVDRVDLAIHPGEVVGLVGESGCGKSTLGRLAVGLLPPSEGERCWKGEPLAGLARDAARRQQLKMQMIFQDPYASLNPRMRVVDIVGEAPVVHGMCPPRARIEYVGMQLNRVGLDPTLMRRYPHQFSGGQRARIGIARALAVKPEFLVCDESVAALDVSIQAQVLNLFMELREGAATSRISSSATTSAWSSTSAIASSSCTSGASSNPGPPPSCSPRRIIRTRRRCWPRSAGSSRESGSSSRSSGRFRRRSRRRPAAISTRAARTRWRSAGPRRRHCAKSRRRRWSACHLNEAGA